MCHHLDIFTEKMLQENELTEVQTMMYKIPFKFASKLEQPHTEKNKGS